MKIEWLIGVFVVFLVSIVAGVLIASYYYYNKVQKEQEEICQSYGLDVYRIQAGWFCVDSSGNVKRYDKRK
jgi:Na+-transporting NADH:ubiquinone oxidoreductase subunit NqrC